MSWKSMGYLLACLGFAASAVEGAGTTGAEFLRAEVSASSAALAAGQANSHGSDMLERNPAGILGQELPSFAFTHFSTFGDTAYEQVEGLYPRLGGGNLAARFFYASTYNFPNVDELGQESGTVENYDVLLNVAYAYPLLPDVQAGLGIKGFESALAGYKRTGLAVDLGARWQVPMTGLSVGASLQNVGSMSRMDAAEEQLPVMANAGLGYLLNATAGQTLKILADVNQPLTGDETTSVLLGAEYSWMKTVFLRGGYRINQELGALSLGGGLQYGGFGMDYAYQPLQDLGANHRFTLYYQFLSGDSQ